MPSFIAFLVGFVLTIIGHWLGGFDFVRGPELVEAFINCLVVGAIVGGIYYLWENI